ncbi:hypothetical protein CKAN_02458300 [Cinnamomum micranthum f. kanehirae]|uniref:Uncharacterized protein n=1 Tax=Cinnamomum micranthum f. kanehirae TaxID=337451 RepID=A0A3S4PV69_9MAGN|nr:hypothetical protein CKAN_02458300 [Cinnamomum micranthum f. kanehirae]
MPTISEDLKAKAEVYYGDEICKEKSKFLLQEAGLPRGLLPLEDIIECGKLTGVKVKELLVWLTLSEISVNDPPTGKLTCKTSTGLFRTFPTDAFEIEYGK